MENSIKIYKKLYKNKKSRKSQISILSMQNKQLDISLAGLAMGVCWIWQVALGVYQV